MPRHLSHKRTIEQEKPLLRNRRLVSLRRMLLRIGDVECFEQRKRTLPLDDGVCLVFLETQLDELAGRLDREKMLGVLRKTWAKMSTQGRAAALALTFSQSERTLVAEALDAPAADA